MSKTFKSEQDVIKYIAGFNCLTINGRGFERKHTFCYKLNSYDFNNLKKTE